MRIRWPIPLTLAFAAAAAHAQLPPNPTTYFAGPSGRFTLPLRRATDNKLYLTVTVKGQPLNLFVDTGATTVLDLDVARRLDLTLVATKDETIGITGVGSTRHLAFVDLLLGKIAITNHQVSILDLSALKALHRRHDMPVFDGLIGADLLAALRARVDFDKLVLEVRRPDRETLDRTGFTRR
jgi:hypothetical protein